MDIFIIIFFIILVVFFNVVGGCKRDLGGLTSPSWEGRAGLGSRLRCNCLGSRFVGVKKKYSHGLYSKKKIYIVGDVYRKTILQRSPSKETHEGAHKYI